MRFVIINNNPILTNSKAHFSQIVPDNWTHRSTATIGFDTASFDIQKEKRFLEEMFFYGLGREITRYSEDGNKVIWQGYINDMVLTEPGQRSRISYNNMYNKTAIHYTALDTSSPPVESETTTSFISDTDSQDKYGIKEIIYDPLVQKMFAARATQLRRVILYEYQNPRVSADYISSDQKPRLKMSCKGYMHTLNWRYYKQEVDGASRNAEDEIALIVSDVGQFVDSTNLGANGSSVNKYKDENKTALEHIRAIAAIGDGNYNRWVAHMFENRKLIYKQASSDIKYSRRLADPKQQIYDAMKAPVPNWEIRPDAWIRTEDIQPFALDPSTVLEDTAVGYIESVTWTETNNNLVLTGSRGDDSKVMVARIAALGDWVL